MKQADVGIAMGITGTEVSREAADMTVTDDNFASIVAAVEEGRAIFGNIKKYLMYLLSSNIGEIGLMAGATLAGLPLPLSAVQILYVNLATDGLPALALAVDPAEPDAMRRPPRDPTEGIFTRSVVFLMLAGGLWSMLINLGLFGWALTSGRAPEHAMALCFVALVLIQLVKAYNFRSERCSVFKRPFANRWLNLAVLWELILLYLIVHVPFLQHALGTYRLSVEEWAIVTATALSVAPVLELAKWLVRLRALGKQRLPLTKTPILGLLLSPLLAVASNARIFASHASRLAPFLSSIMPIRLSLIGPMPEKASMLRLRFLYAGKESRVSPHRWPAPHTLRRPRFADRRLRARGQTDLRADPDVPG